ncbi:MAG: FAD-dependent oxidoreductase [Epsilonproteobacteria bacterium]|nr:FAD-dependent oxidoreductase [Campylobacterota bacterium]
MKFSELVIGGGIAGALSARFLNAPIMEEDELFSKASGAAGAFLFPKVGFDSEYTRFINLAIVESVKFYTQIGVCDTRGVLILPRDERDIDKFEKYQKHIKLPYEKRDGGFFFECGSVVNPTELKEKLKLNVINEKAVSIKKDGEYWVVNDKYYAKNLILATGTLEVFDIPYVKIRPIWGERIEISAKTEIDSSIFYHKNCSLALNGDILKIGATHRRDCLECRENMQEAYELINKANEIGKVEDYEVLDIKGGLRAASVDYFPVVGEVVDVDATLKLNPKVVKGVLPKELVYHKGLYIVNGMGGRGFSNAYVCAKMLRDLIKYKKPLPSKVDSKRLFIKWARKEGERYVKSKKCN